MFSFFISPHNLCKTLFHPVLTVIVICCYFWMCLLPIIPTLGPSRCISQKKTFSCVTKMRWIICQHINRTPHLGFFLCHLSLDSICSNLQPFTMETKNTRVVQKGDCEKSEKIFKSREVHTASVVCVSLKTGASDEVDASGGYGYKAPFISFCVCLFSMNTLQWLEHLEVCSSLIIIWWHKNCRQKKTQKRHTVP